MNRIEYAQAIDSGRATLTALDAVPVSEQVSARYAITLWRDRDGTTWREYVSNDGEVFEYTLTRIGEVPA